MSENDPMTPAEISQYLKEFGFHRSPRTVNRMLHHGEMEAYRTAGGWFRVRKSEVDRWIKEHR